MSIWDGLGAGLVGGIAGIFGAERANQANAVAAKDATANSVWMMQNRHQLEVSDLHKAGLNPILSANGGAPIGTAPAATNQNAMEGLASTAQQAVMLKLQAEKQAQEIQNMKSVKENVDMDTKTKKIDALKGDVVEQLLGAIGLGTSAKSRAGKTMSDQEKEQLKQRIKSVPNKYGNPLDPLGGKLK